MMDSLPNEHPLPPGASSQEDASIMTYLELAGAIVSEEGSVKSTETVQNLSAEVDKWARYNLIRRGTVETAKMRAERKPLKAASPSLKVAMPWSDIKLVFTVPRGISTLSLVLGLNEYMELDEHVDSDCVLLYRLRNVPNVSAAIVLGTSASFQLMVLIDGTQVHVSISNHKEYPQNFPLDAQGNEILFNSKFSTKCGLWTWREDRDMMTKIKGRVSNFSRYQTVLRIVNHWAYRRGIYGRVYGYLSGVAFAILLARVYQDNPKSSTLDLMVQFFATYCEMFSRSWDAVPPVVLSGNPFRYGHTRGRGWMTACGMFDVMQVRTAHEALTNVAKQVNAMTMKVIREEFIRAHLVITEYLLSPKACTEEVKCNRLKKMFPVLCAPYQLNDNTIRSVLRITIRGNSAHDTNMNLSWRQEVMDRLDSLFFSMCNIPHVDFIRPIPSDESDLANKKSALHIIKIGLTFDAEVEAESAPLRTAVQDWLNRTISDYIYNHGIHIEGELAHLDETVFNISGSK